MRINVLDLVTWLQDHDAVLDLIIDQNLVLKMQEF